MCCIVFQMEKIQIDLGKGVLLTAPFKRRMSVDEWTRMVSYINGILSKELTATQGARKISITKK